MENKKTNKREFTGLVVSDKMDKTVVVKITTKVLHPLYKKYVTKSVKYKAHDENNDAKIGDTVRIMECRPISKEKSWNLQEVIERAK
ncbi:30S ribosomal protein S17 [Spirochaeta isovalerica]|uniref:Small ribosomal subunit protein uS17 n=1 Tax=Spirochaeta isovalerica TaxID=150 RepID=A0A841RDT1_9SPIO|nr:30S ribosomal protein S17 [Spirochaeta isovalerica]MBB6482215.1 small subunit ribosomal protein S17 [Spirochaeta isovalerica]